MMAASPSSERPKVPLRFRRTRADKVRRSVRRKLRELAAAAGVPFDLEAFLELDDEEP